MLETFNTLIGIGTLISILVTLSIWILLFLQKTTNRYVQFFKKYAFHCSFLLSLGAIIGSLTYSEIFHLVPCTFCWWQRIFMYPQAIIFATGVHMKDLKMWMVSIILSSIGICFSVYHILLQSGIIGPSGACVQAGVSCARIDFQVFGWITMPIMCLSLFVSILTYAYLAYKN